MDAHAFERLLSELAATRRHFDVVAEGLRGDLRLVAEGVSATREELGSLASGTLAEFTEVRSLVRLGHQELGRRFEALEESVLELERRVGHREEAS
ncbi:MAG TPA: hypothetical protein PK413_00135 [Thermoanaerobaculia bacterium]|nr:hypothetical protein [Thermoanaerobaculia bacterium]